MEVFQSFGRGERVDPEALHEMTQTAGHMDQDLMQVRGRVEDFASDPELLAKVIQGNSLIQQLAAMNPMAAQVINSPEALQKIFSPEMLDVLKEGRKPGEAMIESILGSSQAYE
ncbi:kif1 [Symbiodinium pilosum]|uniref:Kif1 protein n=1 Tax=Symbiodinium pilosum TaxID=2952 RepID=A0A812T6C1_SYMPI|nr:kif1 [Symbiodinium pilosum]